jgi:glycerol-3-phosphate acyltransferase PlsY
MSAVGKMVLGMLGTIVLYLLAFGIGSLPFGFWAGRLRGIDIREHGSGNIGATNVLRILGPAWGVPVLLLDALKGYLPVLIANQQARPSYEVALVGLCAILGHTFSPFVGFKGGKGVATALGVVIGFSYQVAGAALLVFLATVFLTRYVSLGSMLAAVTTAIGFFVIPASFLGGDPLPYQIFGILIAVFIVYKHKSNIERIRQGTESRFGEKKASETPPVS